MCSPRSGSKDSTAQAPDTARGVDGRGTDKAPPAATLDPRRSKRREGATGTERDACTREDVNAREERKGERGREAHRYGGEKREGGDGVRS